MRPLLIRLWLVLVALCWPCQVYGQTRVLSDTAKLVWTASTADPIVTTYRAELWPKGMVVAGVPSGPTALMLDFGKPPMDPVSFDEIGPILKPLLPPNTELVLFLRALSPFGNSPLSAPTVPFIASPQFPGCTGHSIIIAVKTFSATLAVGDRGHVTYTLSNSFPVTKLQVLLNGNQVVGEVPATDLRDDEGMAFSMPRIRGSYSLTLRAEDSTGCAVVTTAVRTVTVN